MRDPESEYLITIWILKRFVFGKMDPKSHTAVLNTVDMTQFLVGAPRIRELVEICECRVQFDGGQSYSITSIG